MPWPQLILVALLAADVTLTCTMHGTYQKRNGWGAAVGAVLMLLLLYWGGFFSPLAR